MLYLNFLNIFWFGVPALWAEAIYTHSAHQRVIGLVKTTNTLV